MAEKELKDAEGKAASVKFGKVTKNTKVGTARLGVKVPTPGKLTVSGPDIKTVSGQATGPGEVQALIAAQGDALKILKTKGKVEVTVKVKLSGPAEAKQATTKVTLVKK